MVVVLGLVLYGMSAREPLDAAGMDGSHPTRRRRRARSCSTLMVLGLDGRPDRRPRRSRRTAPAALGLNLVLLVNLAGIAWLSGRFASGRVPFHHVERWQTSYLPVFAIWAAAVVVILPPAFGFE